MGKFKRIGNGSCTIPLKEKAAIVDVFIKVIKKQKAFTCEDIRKQCLIKGIDNQSISKCLPYLFKKLLADKQIKPLGTFVLKSITSQPAKVYTKSSE